MAAPVRYLEAEKIDELAAQLRSEGYSVDQPPGPRDHRYDLVAQRGDERIAIEVKALSSLRDAVGQVSKLREQAHREGFDEFRLVVVTPPRTPHIDIQGLDTLIEAYMRERVPPELSSLSSNTVVRSIGYLDVQSLDVRDDGIDVLGQGVVEVDLQYGGTRDGNAMEADFPFRFHVLLNHHLGLDRVYDLAVDTSGFSE